MDMAAELQTPLSGAALAERDPLRTVVLSLGISPPASFERTTRFTMHPLPSAIGTTDMINLEFIPGHLKMKN
jgi:hypothetical protein